MMKCRTKVNGWIAAVAAVSVLAAGCGVRTDTPVESGTTAPVETTAVQTEPGTVAVSYTHLQRNVVRLKSNLVGSFLNHLAEQFSGFLGPVGQLDQVQIPHT